MKFKYKEFEPPMNTNRLSSSKSDKHGSNTRILSYLCLSVFICGSLLSSSFAVTTSHWTHTSESDFKAGKFHNVVATNLGDMKLSRAIKTILGTDEHVSAVHAMVEAPDGTIYAGTGPEGVLLAIKNDKAEKIADLGSGVSIFSLLIDKQGRLLIGTGGEKGQIFRIEKAGEKPKEIFAEEGVHYVWSICQTPDGDLFAATGPNGQLFRIDSDGKHSVLFKCDENNLTSMVSDGKDTLYVGSDPNGLVYRINRKSKDSFVLYDAAESEISSLLLTKDGTLYAATAESTAPGADQAEAPTTAEQNGRPEGDTGGVPIPTQPPEAPKPPQPTPPNPGEPAPIPKKQPSQPKQSKAEIDGVIHPLNLLILDDPNDPSGGAGGGDNGDSGADKTKSPLKDAKTASNAEENKPAEAAGGQTNAIYRIDHDGFVTEVFRQPMVIYSLIEQNGSLLVGTGGEGLIYQVNPSAEETVVLAKVDPKEVISLLAAKDGRVFLGLANSGDIAVMTPGYADDGTFTSPALDATQISRFGKLQLHGTLPKETTLTVATRSSNVGEDADAGWSAWTSEKPANAFMQIESPNARFLQYRLTFKSNAGKESPIVDDIDVAYQMPNLAPVVKSIKITTKAEAPDAATPPTPGKSPAEHHTQTVTWEASDPNTDALQYAIYFRSNSPGPWILLKDKLTEATYDWDTRSVADGRYEIKVVASDSAANALGEGKAASRVSDPLVVDNTPPVVGDIKATAHGANGHLEMRAVDRTSTIASLEYSVDSSTDWQLVLPSDKIADSPEEAYAFDTAALRAGAHQITIRATDAHGNVGYESVPITIEPPTASK